MVEERKDCKREEEEEEEEEGRGGEETAAGLRDTAPGQKEEPSSPRSLPRSSTVCMCLHESVVAILTSSWISCWAPGEELRKKVLPRHADYRDHVPPQIEHVVKTYAPYIREGRWTFGLLEMWWVLAVDA